MNMSYQLGLDWNISVPHYENKTLGFVSLQVGMHNYVDYYAQKVEVNLSFLRSMKKLSQRIRGYFWVLLDYVE